MGITIEGDCAATRQSQMASELEQLNSAIVGVQKGIEDLRGRLAPILRNDPEVAATGEDSLKPEALVPHAGTIREARRQLENAGRELTDLAGRCEV